MFSELENLCVEVKAAAAAWRCEWISAETSLIQDTKPVTYASVLAICQPAPIVFLLNPENRRGYRQFAFAASLPDLMFGCFLYSSIITPVSKEVLVRVTIKNITYLRLCSLCTAR